MEFPRHSSPTVVEQSNRDGLQNLLHVPSRASLLATHAESPTILLAEDDDDLREVTSAILEMSGYKSIPCCDAECALALLRTPTPIDLLLTDLEMPGKSGVELARELLVIRPELPVMLVSGSLIPASLHAEMKIRSWKFFAKPYSLPAFLAGIATLLDTGNTRKISAP